MSKKVDWSLYLVTDPSYYSPQELPDVISRAIAGGVSVVQLRDKHATDEQFLQQARIIQQARATVPLFVNDRVQVARALGLHLHIGQSDIPYVQARQLLPPQQMIGLTIENEQQWHRCLEECAAAGVPLPDVIGLGPVRDTATKPDAPAACGVEGVARIATLARRAGVASVAIGGVDKHNAGALAATDIDGICVVSAIMGADDPFAAAQDLLSSFQEKKSAHS